MKKSEIFLDLSKLTEEQIKGLVPIIEGAGDRITSNTRHQLVEGCLKYFHMEYCYLYFSGSLWTTWSNGFDQKEISYSEFLELFGKTEVTETDHEGNPLTYWGGLAKPKITWEWFYENKNAMKDTTENAQTEFNLEEIEQFLKLRGQRIIPIDDFNFPHAKEGDFPDLKGFKGVRMEVKGGGTDYKWEDDIVYVKIRDGYFAGNYFTANNVRPIKQSLTYQELVEKIGLERACELAGVEMSKTEIKN